MLIEKIQKPHNHKIPSTFFISVHPVQMAVILMSYYLLMMGWLWPEGVGTRIFGDLNQVILYLGTHYNAYMLAGCISVVLINWASTIGAVILCWRLKLTWKVSIKWFVQTSVFGLPSVMYLVSPQNALVNIYGYK